MGSLKFCSRMNPLTLFLALIISVTSISISYADWKQVDESSTGNIYYVDFNSIKERDGFVKFWRLTDYSEPNKSGILSTKAYNQVDCKKLRYKTLRYSYHKKPMGEGRGENGTSGKIWNSPYPKSSFEVILKAVCKFVR